MICQWKELLSILPPDFRAGVDRAGRENAREVRLRVGSHVEIVTGAGCVYLEKVVTQEDLHYVANSASRYSPWAAATQSRGYLVAPGGHRIGLCGEAVVKDGEVSGFRQWESLCIRVARDFPGISGELASRTGSVLIMGAPGWGKTTLLRDLARQIGETEAVCVIDERGELFPKGILRGKRMDVLSLCPKRQGIFMALKTMSPEVIAVDEITEEGDAEALIQASGCGVRLLATVHARDPGELCRKPLYQRILSGKLFDTRITLDRDRHYTVERMV